MNMQKESFERLTSQQKSDLEKEVSELFLWNERERAKLEAELRKEGKWQEFGLDSNQQHYAGIIKEFQERFHAIKVKYGIIK